MYEPRQINPRRGASRRGKLVALILALLVLVFVVGPLGSLYVDWLWFQSVGYASVFETRLNAQVIIFAIAAVAFFLVFVANGLVALHLAERRPFLVGDVLRVGGGRPHPLLRLAVILASAFLALLVGLSYGGSWDVVLRFLNPSSFGVADPLFGRDVSFFVFSLPFYDYLLGWVFTTLILALLGSFAIYAAQVLAPQLGAIQANMEGRAAPAPLQFGISSGAKVHLSVLVALLALAFAASHLLGILKLVYSRTSLFFGAGYAEVNARQPALWLMAGAAVVFAVLVLLGIRRRGYAFSILGLVIWIGVAIVAGGIYPGLVQRFQVQPSELERERPYLAANIDMTNRAYQLDAVVETDYPAADAVTPQEVEANPTTVKNFRLWDPAPLLDTYNQIQSIRLYYDFLDVDVDRYIVDGDYRQVMLSARELSPERLSSQAQTWINRRLQYTHGYGVAASPVNEVTPEGLPQLFMRDVPPQGKITLARPEIYYGENTTDFVIVKTNTEEFDFPKGDDNVYVRYEGQSGVPVGSFLRRLFFAWQFGDLNILLADAIKSDSLIMYNREIKSRAQLVAPFLQFDGDPYVVVADGRLYWVLDAYTYTERYPYSQRVNFGRAGQVNYVRNSVKVVEDAYEGSLRFYLADPSDPMVKSYAGIFPGLFRPLEEMSPELRAHVRYPEDLFKVQAELYRTYHMRDPRVFYNKEDLWNIPNEIYLDKKVPIQPYYIIMRLPGEQREEFALILPYTPPNKDNMITWLAARSDGAAYGKLVAYKYPKDKLVFGPMQIEARIDQDPTISQQLTLWNQGGSRVIRGNMIVIPIGLSNLYVEPIYLQSEQTKLPELKRVVLGTGNRVIMEPTVPAALASLFNVVAAPPAATAQPPAAAQPPATAPPPAAQDAKAAAQALLDRLNKVQTDVQSIQDDLRRLLQTLGGGQ